MPRWLHLGMSIKRWLVLLVIGITFLSLSAGYFLQDLYHSGFYFPAWVAPLTLQFLPRVVRGAMFLSVGVVLTAVALLRLNRTVIAALLPRGNARVVDLLYQKRQLTRGPKVVAIGGGTGLSMVLSGLKGHTGNLTAIVTVADDGGSSGRLRRELSILPPGDFRQCIVALADVQPLMSALLQYRFKKGTELEGHNLGNLLLAAMADITGNFELGVRELSHVLAVQGQIMPSTLENVALVAELRDKSTVHGESNMHQDHASEDVKLEGRAPIDRVFLVPANAVGYPEAVQAILDADIVVIGPGSLYTSVLPNLLVKDIARALCASAAFKVFVCNVATEPGETDHYSAEDFVHAIHRHVDAKVFDAVITNTRLDAVHPPYWRSDVVAAEWHDTQGVEIITADVVDENNAVRHDPAKLARAIIRAWARHSRPSRRHEAPERVRMA
ncbi:MAG TPA: uridine diphosphate-N-acetylglucosamine-binding protein YvcK [Chloroflexota bacterium]|nr:uridine diphosphate-N-acetylglucosamine-binding protein YvcK [Chloroflexota bacterium]